MGEFLVRSPRHRSAVFLHVVEVQVIEELHQLRLPQVDVVDPLAEIQDGLFHFVFPEHGHALTLEDRSMDRCRN